MYVAYFSGYKYIYPLTWYFQIIMSSNCLWGLDAVGLGRSMEATLLRWQFNMFWAGEPPHLQEPVRLLRDDFFFFALKHVQRPFQLIRRPTFTFISELEELITFFLEIIIFLLQYFCVKIRKKKSLPHSFCFHP